MSPKRSSKIIMIRVDEKTGDLTCEPTVLHAKPGDTITFSGGKKPFSIVAKGSPCFNRLDIRSDQKRSDVSVQVPKSAKPGVYSFACAVNYTKNRSDKISMDANCPTIIIDPGFTG